MWQEFTRLYWHGWPGDFEAFLSMKLTDRYLATSSLDQLIEVSNERGSGRPSDDR